MDIQLHRLDLLQCGALEPGTLEVLPVGKKKQQKIAVGAGNWEDLLEDLGRLGKIREDWETLVISMELNSGLTCLVLARDLIRFSANICHVLR